MPRVLSKRNASIVERFGQLSCGSDVGPAPAGGDDSGKPSVVLVCGPLGSGKTTLIQSLFLSGTVSAHMADSGGPKHSPTTTPGSATAPPTKERWALVITEPAGANRFFADNGQNRAGAGAGAAVGYDVKMEHEDGHRELFVAVTGGACLCHALASSPTFMSVVRIIRRVRPSRLFVELGLNADVDVCIQRFRDSFGVNAIHVVFVAEANVLGSLLAPTNPDHEEAAKMLRAQAASAGCALLRGGGGTGDGVVREWCDAADVAIVTDSEGVRPHLHM